MKFPFGFMVLSVGCLIVAFACFQIYRFREGSGLREKARMSWVHVHAVVLAVDRDYAWQRGGQKKVRYKYELYGSTYTSDRTTFFGELRWFDSRRSEEPATAIYEGGVVNVLVNPADPAVAVRLPEEPSDVEVYGLMRFYIGLLSVGCVAAIVGSAMMYTVIRTNLKSGELKRDR